MHGIGKAPDVASPRDELVRAFVELHRLNTGDRIDRLASDAHLWAWERVSEIVAAGGQEAVDVVDELLHADGADDIYNATVGAGPLEDLLHRDGPAVAELIAARCRVDAVWRAAVSTVCGHDLPDPVKHTLRLYMSDAG